MPSNDPQPCIPDLFDRWLAGAVMAPADAILVERWVISAWPVLRERYHAIRRAA
jgi:hypothetical protein